MNKQRKGNSRGIEWWQTWSPELAYVLGFAFADGGVGKNRNSLTLSQSEKEILENMASIVPNGQLSYSLGAKVWRLRFCEPNLNSILATHGIVANKTVYGSWDASLPIELIPHYIRGFFDGDGHIFIASVAKDVCHVGLMFVCHSKEFLMALEQTLRCYGASARKITQDGNNFRLRYNRHSDLACIHSILYPTTAQIYLDRKKRVFDEVIAYIRHSQGRKGSSHGNAKLNEQEVKQIRLMRSEGKMLKEIAAVFKVNFRTISIICTRNAWRHVL